jgi:hypothetical protein
VERIGHKARGFAVAEAWDIAQHRAMTPDERRRVAKALRDRFFGRKCPDVRDAAAGLRRGGKQRHPQSGGGDYDASNSRQPYNDRDRKQQ